MRAERRLLAAAALGIAALPLAAFDASDAWPSGTVQIHLQLDGGTATPALPGGGLIDGAANWNAAIKPALDDWNGVMTRTKLSVVTASTAAIGDGNEINNVFFSADVFGEAWGERTLAITTIWSANDLLVERTESDILFNTKQTWNSYRGALRNGSYDIRRVALHELGHVIGLDHPDEAQPPQTVTAVMNSTVSNVETLQTDDIAGAQALYGKTLTAPTITRQSTGGTIAAGSNVTLDFDLNGAKPPAPTPIEKYGWIYTPPGGDAEFLFTEENSSLLLGGITPDNAGSYLAVAASPDYLVASNPMQLTVTPATGGDPAQTRLFGLATRGIAGDGNRSLIVGIALTGTKPHRIIFRGLGPALQALGVPGTIADPQIRVVNVGGQVIASNNDWSDTNAAELVSETTRIGLTPALAAGSKDAAVIVSLAPGVYTALVTPQTGTDGVALVEAYDLDADTDPGGRLTALSTRGYVGTGGSIMIGGLVVKGAVPRTFLFRAVGDTMKNQGVTGTLDDPTLTILNGPNRLRWVDDWDTPAAWQPKLRTSFTNVGLGDLTDRQESAVKLTLFPGAYTVQLAGLDDGTGVALLEIYETDE